MKRQKLTLVEKVGALIWVWKNEFSFDTKVGILTMSSILVVLITFFFIGSW